MLSCCMNPREVEAGRRAEARSRARLARIEAVGAPGDKHTTITTTTTTNNNNNDTNIGLPPRVVRRSSPASRRARRGFPIPASPSEDLGASPVSPRDLDASPLANQSGKTYFVLTNQSGGPRLDSGWLPGD